MEVFRRLTGRVAIVTGASRGIGRAIAIRLARDGARVVINFLRQQDAAAALEGDIAAAGGEALLVAADVRERSAVEVLAQRTMEKWGRVDILVNNAGIEVVAPILELTDAQFDDLVGVHIKGCLHCAQVLAPYLRRSSCGRIINIGSVAGLGTAVGSIAGYAVVKSAVNMLTKRLAFELANDAVTVNAVCPGAVKTEMLQELAQKSTEFAQFIADVRSRVMLGRLAEPQEIASVVAFLASDDSSYMTGQILAVDGGRLDLLTRSA